MSEEKIKTPKKAQKRKKPHIPWRPGESGNPNGRPKGRRNFRTDFEIAAREIAKAKKLGETPEPIYIELMARGIQSGLKGNYNFWKDIAERIYGKEPDVVDLTEKLKADEKDFKTISEFEKWLKNKLKTR